MYQNLWDTVKAVLRESYCYENFSKKKRSQINNQNFYVRTSLVFQWLRLCSPNARNLGLILVSGK